MNSRRLKPSRRSRSSTSRCRFRWTRLRVSAPAEPMRARRATRGFGRQAEDSVPISESTGGGFGSRIPGCIAMAIPALLSKKANAPVMMRIAREDEHYIGRARPAVRSRIKAGFDKEGRLLAVDLFNV